MQSAAVWVRAAHADDARLGRAYSPVALRASSSDWYRTQPYTSSV